MIKPLCLTLICCIAILSVKGQEVIRLNNPSLEGKPQCCTVPKGWNDCGFEESSPPDIHPDGIFGVDKPAADGATYVGLVARDDDSWECIGQELPVSFLAGTCYQLSLKMGKADTLISSTRLSRGSINFQQACVLRLWAGYKDKDGYEMLAETEPVDHYEWKEYILDFTPAKDYNYLYFEIYYASSKLKPYCGHVLIDDISAIVPCSLIKDNQTTARDF